MKKCPHAVALGQMAAGKKKRITERDRRARKQRMQAINARRREKKP